MIWAVLDTNVLVSGLGWRGAPARVVDAAVRGRFVLVTSEPLLDELGRVLAYPKLRRAFPDPDAMVQLVREITIVVEPAEAVSVAEEDEDNRPLEAALEARADVVVTGDERLLASGPTFQGVRLLRPRDFLTLLDRATPPRERG